MGTRGRIGSISIALYGGTQQHRVLALALRKGPIMNNRSLLNSAEITPRASLYLCLRREG